MTLSFKEIQLKKVYEKLIDVCLNDHPLSDLKPYVDDQFMGYGSALDEVLYGWKGLEWMVLRQRGEISASEYSINRHLIHEKIDIEKGVVYFVEEIEFTIYLEEGNHGFTLRLSTMLHYELDQWKILHFHGSTADMNTSDGNAWPIEEWKRRNAELQREVNNRTQELQLKNRELEIETSLEKVRAIAMGMTQPDDLALISEILFNQIKALGFCALRNTEVIINHDNIESITSYYYSDYGVTGTVNVNYNSSPVLKKWADDLKKSDDAFAEVIITEEEISEWINYRLSLGYQPDLKLDQAKEVFYYSYSTGLGALSISSFSPASDDEINILKRFRNVFQLAYKKYVDISLAEAQAREAQIEAALEKVRSRTMAMQSSDELPEVANVIDVQTKSLGIPLWSVSYNILSEDRKSCICIPSSEGQVQAAFSIPFEGEKSFHEWMDAIERGDTFYVQELTGKALEEHYTFLLSLPGIQDAVDPLEEAGISLPTHQINHLCFFKHGILLFITYDKVPENHETFKRFTTVFEQTYARFLDLQKAETQAREAQIEAALEKVRSRSLAVTRTDEFNEVVVVVFEKLGELRIPVSSATIATNPDNSKDRIVYGCGEGEAGLTALKFHLPYFPNAFMDDLILEQGNTHTGYISKVYSEEDKNNYYDHVFEYTELKHLPEDIKEQVRKSKSYGLSTAYTRNSSISVNDFTGNILDENQTDILKRFSRVFEQAYVRFLDLQKAEAQAREGQIEAALERVRAASMAMHKTNELGKVVEVLFKQFSELDLDFYQVWINIFILEEGISNCWFSPVEGVIKEAYTAVVPLGPFEETSIKSWRAGEEFSYLSWRGLEEVDAITKSLTEMTGHASFVEIQARKRMDRIEIVDCNHKYGVLAMAKNDDITEEDRFILKRFTKVFEQTYTRFLDLQKAEAQARVAQIEAAMERIRSRALAMHSSEELMEVMKELRRQIDLLGQLDLEASVIHLYPEGEEMFESIAAVRPPGETGEIVLANVFFPVDATDRIKYMMDMYNSEESEYTIEFDKEMAEEWQEVMLEHAPQIAKRRVGFVDKTRLSDRSEFWNFADFNGGSLLLVTHSPASDDTKEVLKKARTVFDLAYKRFLDLKKAESQAREAQIEVAVERVRAKALAMHNSSQILEVVSTLHNEMHGLEIHGVAAATIYLQEDDGNIRMWDLSSVKKKKEGFEISLDIKFKLEDTDPRLFIRKVWNNQKKYFIEKQGKEDMAITLEWLRQYYPEHADGVDAFLKSNPWNSLWHPSIQLENGKMSVDILDEDPPEEIEPILLKMGAAFDLAYRRFQDLKHAEAQAREAQIETALEKIRSHTMGMRSSDDLSNVATVMFDQLKILGGDLYSFGIVLCDEQKNEVEQWHRLPGTDMLTPFYVPKDLDYIHQYRYNQWKEGKELFSIIIPEDYINEHFELMFALPSVMAVFESMEEKDRLELKIPTWEIDYGASFKYGYLLISALKPFEEKHIFPRFAKVFEQTYTRFLDLKKAEAQAREAQIETALERVRASTMAMHRTEDLHDAALLMFQQIEDLGTPLMGCGFNIWDDDRKAATAWMTGLDRFQPPFKTLSTEDVFLRIHDAAERGDLLFVEEQDGEALEEHYQYMASIPVFKEILVELEKKGLSVPSYQIIHCAYFAQGYLMFISLEPVAYAFDIFKRFAKVFEQTYTRFLDLQKSEAQVREAQIEMSLERVRSRTMAMHKSDELADTAAHLFNQLIELGIKPYRCNIGIIDAENDKCQLWSTTNKGNVIPLGTFIPLTDTPLFISIYKAWKNKLPISTIKLEGQDRLEMIKYFIQFIPFAEFDPKEMTLEKISRDFSMFNTFFFKQGFISIHTNEVLAEPDMNIIQRFTKVFEQTYTRFLDLQKAESQADLIRKEKDRLEKALKDLKETQSQLIHSEKMASLGELTAGIAHEIQNPLNFVNNFSEVSSELIEEAKEEMEAGDYEEAIEIMEDLMKNLQKIHHHGERASSIVNGMLDHSRVETGEKVIADINQLADECLRLAYHGMRAKDRDFQAEFDIQLDPELPKISIVSQDIGRVILNLINNAFQAAFAESMESEVSTQKPKVIVSTKSLEDKIQISIEDNGPGIPDDIINKIFQPFFTTKPTGQGTGLGLSLSYDIVNAHGGELKVETQEGKGSEFKIILPIV